MVKPATNNAGTSFTNGACYTAGAFITGQLLNHAVTHHKPEDPCGCKKLLAKVALVYFDMKKCIFGAGPRHVATAEKIRRVSNQ